MITDLAAHCFYYLDLLLVLGAAAALLWTLSYYRTIRRLQQSLLPEGKTDRLLLPAIILFTVALLAFAYRLVLMQGILEATFSPYTDTLTSIIFCSGAIFVLYAAQTLRKAFVTVNNEFAIVFENAPVGIFSVNAKGVIDFLNPKFLEMSGGRRPQDIIGKSPSAIMLHRATGLDIVIRDALLKEESFKTETSFMGRDGRMTYQRWLGTPVMGGNQKRMGNMLILADDVTSDKELEESIRLHSEELEKQRIILENVVDNIALGAILLDQQGKPLFVNRIARSFLNCDAEKAAGAYLTFLQKFAVQDIEKLVHACLAGTPMRVSDANIGTRIVSLSSVCLTARGSGNLGDAFLGHLILIADVTEERLLERAKDDFMSIASHEMRSPLTVIRGNAQLIREALAGDAKNGEVLEMASSIENGSVRLMKIVNDFLDVVRLEGKEVAFEKEKVDFVQVAREVAAELERTSSDKNVSLTFHEPLAPLPPVMADQERARQVVTNLVMNAVQYTDAGESIDISIEQDGPYLKMWVRDTGIGIDPDSRKYLFQKFSTAGKSFIRSKEYGSGLGLYICKILTGAMGGKIQLEESELGKGSTFSFSLLIASD